ncbi:hypothetical protein KPH14_004829 [Odynerus spinipes]|uniref:Uncharacterized protein n=1 Tax=Odynerus spinipes TaxID=1348599 RepID=A0AAD9RMU5_9HYME|nr:hypothetical protein KPH14_004829 [Odynerus spinipes]
MRRWRTIFLFLLAFIFATFTLNITAGERVDVQETIGRNDRLANGFKVYDQQNGGRKPPNMARIIVVPRKYIVAVCPPGKKVDKSGKCRTVL